MDYKKYTEKGTLSTDELEAISEELIQAKFDREKREALTARLKNEFGVTRETTPKKKNVLFSKLAIAAILVGFIGIVTYSVILYTTPSYDSVVKASIENLITIDNQAVVTRGDESVHKETLAAINAYKNQQYDESIIIWKKIISAEKVEGASYYNLAICYLQKTPPEPSVAINFLVKARNAKTVQEEANWALALAYIQANRKAEAKEILEEIIRAKAYKYKRAEVLLTKLQK
ncbi:hypothetical protein [Kordia jejudonensis]|uniref:hypothetical protein n=1 Tax=Kordia jejudonensis TaxID=1348245 RepID=UPI000629032E|nr:hypothetical protein [Kordia jejudonensis]